MQRKYQNITETIGRTPVVKLSRLAPPGVEIFVKIEAFNPMGSVKDRFALAAIEDAEQKGLLKPGQTLAPLEPRPPEEPAKTRERRLREETPLTHRAAVLTLQGDLQAS